MPGIAKTILMYGILYFVVLLCKAIATTDLATTCAAYTLFRSVDHKSSRGRPKQAGKRRDSHDG
ncbi:hypothetical protein HYDPIDRAFT_110805 [Hydnomerulius pinastri MD-312]|nr:hypothetical protein HYDPIDRAFT_110805 [Hydnomerulius pinastri MD-312]